MTTRTPKLSTTASRIRPPVFGELQKRIDALQGRQGDLVPLQIGDTWLAPPAPARRALADLDAEDASLHRYGPTAGMPALREAIAKSVRRHGLDVDPADDVLVGNGGTHALFCAARAVLDAGDEVLMASPYWPLSPGVFLSCGAVPVEVPLTQRLYDGSLASASEVKASFAAAVTPRTKAIYVTSPNNPDGKVLSSEELAGIADVAREHDLWVFSDEVYADVVFVNDGRHVSIASLPEMASRTIVLHSMSKSHALAGSRVGFVLAPGEVIASARRISTHSGFNVSMAMQRVALAALEDEAFGERARTLYREARDKAAWAFEGSSITTHVADGATYLFLDFRAAFDAMGPAAGERPLLTLLERAVDRGVLLAPGDAFGAPYERHARLCYTAVPLDRVLVGIERLESALAAMQRGEP